MRNTPLATLKITNEKKVFDYIYTHKRATSLILQKDLSLSRPTVAQILKDFSQNSIIYSRSLADSTGGRKANLYEFNPYLYVAIGCEIMQDRFEIAAIDLYGDMQRFERHFKAYENSVSYYDEICNIINTFIHGLHYSSDKILGVGIALQGLISANGKEIIYGKILDCKGLTIHEFTKRIPYPCAFRHDAEAMANVELWFDSSLENAIYLNIRTDLSGSIIVNREFFQAGSYKSGIFEHMSMVPNGRPCYCGKKGCVNAYCSISALLKPQEDIGNFFIELRSGDPQYVKRWDEYLNNLATAIDDFHMIMNSNVILAGTLSKYLIQEDIDFLHKSIQEKTAFPSDDQYISISNYSNLPACTGAALPFIKDYLKSVMES